MTRQVLENLPDNHFGATVGRTVVVYQIEMRDTVREPKFALRKALAFELERMLPEHFIPRYSMVMFHANIPYLVAQQRGEVQKSLLEEFTQHVDSLDEVDLDAAAEAAKDRLKPISSIQSDPAG